MESIFFKAHWSKADERMIVELELPKSQAWTQVSKARLRNHKKPTERYIERFDKEAWRSFIDTLDEAPLRLGGIKVVLTGQAVGDAEKQMKAYLRQVDRVYQLTGQTDFM